MCCASVVCEQVLNKKGVYGLTIPSIACRVDTGLCGQSLMSVGLYSMPECCCHELAMNDEGYEIVPSGGVMHYPVLPANLSTEPLSVLDCVKLSI